VDPYLSFAGDYHWLLDDEQLTGRPFVAAYEQVVSSLGPRARVLDAACGIGVEAVELARRGLRVTGTDASRAMIAQARARVVAAGVDVELAACAWSQLASRFGRQFELVICNGNSLVHASGPRRLVTALEGLAAVLGDGGRLVIGSRNFEHLRQSRPGVEVAARSVARYGIRCVRFYSWHIPRMWSAEHVASVHLALMSGDEVDHRRHDVRFVPYTWAELASAVDGAGLRIESSSRASDQPRYTLVLGR
jgi:SAM-dependent methyltransferase